MALVPRFAPVEGPLLNEFRLSQRLHRMSSLTYPIPVAVARKQSLPKAIHSIDPIADHRWNEFVSRHPRASMFHSRAWLQALKRTYGYKPTAFTTALAGEPLQDAVVFCEVDSWLSGRRLVSLPFSDHCDLLVKTQDDLDGFVNAVEKEVHAGEWQYLEIRPLQPIRITTALACTPVSYHFHQLDLRPGLKAVYSKFHKDSIQRKIRRSQREALRYEEGSN